MIPAPPRSTPLTVWWRKFLGGNKSELIIDSGEVLGARSRGDAQYSRAVGLSTSATPRNVVDMGSSRQQTSL
jgi:hypothetical protein